MHAPHQHANSTPPFRKVWLRAWAGHNVPQGRVVLPDIIIMKEGVGG